MVLRRPTEECINAFIRANVFIPTILQLAVKTGSGKFDALPQSMLDHRDDRSGYLLEFDRAAEKCLSVYAGQVHK